MNVLCFGEPLVRLATSAHERLEEAHILELDYSGAEVAVAISLAQQGEKVSFVTKLASNRLGSNALMTLSKYGINTSKVLRSNERMGIYFKERGKSIRPTIVTYDRTGSALACAKSNDFDWDHILNGIEIVFLSGIMPAISAEMAEASLNCLCACKERGIRTVFDINYRRSMWLPHEAQIAFEKLFPYIDILTASEDDIVLLNDKSIKKDEMFRFCLDWMSTTRRKFGIDYAAFVVRRVNNRDCATFQGALITNDSEAFLSQEREAAISDLSGTGSMFSAGILHAILSKWDMQFVVDYSVQSSALKATIRGDYSVATESEIARVMTNTSQLTTIQ